jgi:outer membrane receptor protein involved in Fe transport
MGLRARPEPFINESGAYISLNGADLTNDVTGGILSIPSLSAIRETSVTTSAFKADQGRTTAAIMQLTSDSGTNEWHGTASFFRRGNHWSALPATFAGGGEAPSFDRAQFSGGLGGPLVRDRAFWFASFEYLKQNSLLQAGERDFSTRKIQNRLSATPLTSTLGLFRTDWRISDRDSLAILYAGERSEGDDLPALQRTLTAGSQRQHFNEEFDQGLLHYLRTFSPTLTAEMRLGFSSSRAASAATTSGLQLNFPGLQAGAPFRAPALPRHNRWQLTGNLVKIAGEHTFKFGTEIQRINAEYAFGFGSGSIEFAENFASADRNGDGRIDDDDLLINLALRNVSPQERSARLWNTHFASFIRNDWRINRNLTLNLGVRWQFDTNEKNLRGYRDLNPLVHPFLRGERTRDKNNFSPRIGFVWSFDNDRFIVRNGYSLLFDRIPLQYNALEQTLDGRHVVIAATEGSSLSSDGRFAINTPTLLNPFAGASTVWPNSPGINILDNSLQNPMVQQFSLELGRHLAQNLFVHAGYLHNFGSRMLLGRSPGSVFNPMTRTFDRVVNLEASGKTKYDALTVRLEKRLAQRWQFFASYTLSKSFNYTNSDQLPFFTGIIDSNNPHLEYGPSPFDQRHRFSLSGEYEFGSGLRAATVWAMATGTPMDILLPDASARLPFLQRNAGGRLIRTGVDLNRFLMQLNAAGGVNGAPLPFAGADARFNDSFQSFDLRLTKTFKMSGEMNIELGGEFFNLFNITNILGWSNLNYAGFDNVLARDTENVGDPGYLKASNFGHPLTTAGRLFTGGGPRSFQFVAKFSF